MSATVMYGQPVVEKLKQHILTEIQTLGKVPKLATLGFHSNAQWLQYISSLKNSAENFNCCVENINVPDNIESDDFAELIEKLNADPNVDGVLIQQPLPSNLKNCVDFLCQNKDIDGLTSKNIYSIYTGKEVFVPATAMAVVELLDFYEISLQGANVVILGRGTAVGKPLSLMMLNRNATPTICHTKTKNLAEIAKSAEILVSACGQAGMIGKTFVNKNSVVVDVGLSFVDGKTSGDVNFSEVCEGVKAISPVPKGIGPVTRACLFKNLVNATIRNISKQSK